MCTPTATLDLDAALDAVQAALAVRAEAFTGLVPLLAWAALRAVLGPCYEAANSGLAAEVARRSGTAAPSLP